MTIDPFICRDTDAHVLPKQAFFPTEISIAHHQLRHFLSSPQPDILYFVNRQDVYSLDTKTRKRTLVKDLPFEVICSATGHGWFCAGGLNNGYFAAFRLPEEHEASSTAVDAPLSGFSDTGGLSYSSSTENTSPIPPRIRVERLGNEIINSVSIHLLRSRRGDLEDEVVALTSSNDKSVRIYSLTQDCELHSESFPFAMNHATLSPDGKLLVAVGDKEYIYFYERLDEEVGSAAKSNSIGPKFAKYNWNLLSRFELHRPPNSDYAAYFTTAWSPSGILCATASEPGYITVYDTRTIVNRGLDAEAVVAVVPSSRPGTAAGAIRTMCFTPEPWDLLIWSEQCGRVCVGDLRSGLSSRQVIELDPKAPQCQQVELKDSSSDREQSVLRSLGAEADLFSHSHQGNGSVSSTNLASSYIEQLLLQRRQTNPAIEFDPLTPQERQILEGLRTTRQREEVIQHERVSLPTHLQLQMARRQELADRASLDAQRESQLHESWTERQRRAASGRQARALREALDEHRQHDELEQVQRRWTPRSINYSSSETANQPLQGTSRASYRDATRRNMEDTARRNMDEASTLLSLQDMMREAGQQRADGPENENTLTRQPSQSHRRSPSDSAPDPANTSTYDPWRTIESAMERAAANPLPAPVSSSYDQPSSASTYPTSRLLELARDRNRGPDLERYLEYVREFERHQERHTTTRNANGSSASGTAHPSTSYPTPAASVLPAITRDRGWGAESEMDRRMRQLTSVTDSTWRERLWSVRNGAAGRGAVTPRMAEYSTPASWGLNIGGVALGRGGRMLYVATEEGIFELQLNYHERKFFAAVEPR